MAHTTIPRSVRYTWDTDSKITRLDAQLDDDGYYVVRLFPNKNAADGTLADVPGILKRCGIQDAYPDVKEGEDVLVMANVKDLNKVIRTLTGAEYVAGTPNLEELKSEKPGTDKVDTVKWHGRVGLIGHASILAAGLIQKPFDWGRIVNAPLGAINPVLMSWLGSGKDNVDVPQLMRDMRVFFAKEGIALPPLSGEEQHRGFVDTAKHFLAAHPIEVGSSLGVIGSFGMINSGIKGMRAGGSGWSRIWLGGINIVRDAIAVFVPEKKKKESEVEELQNSWVDSATKLPGELGHLAAHPGDIPNAAWGFVQEAPLRMVGILSLVSDVLYAKDAFDAWKKNAYFKTDAFEQSRMAKLEKAVEAQNEVNKYNNEFHRLGDTQNYKNLTKARAVRDRLDAEALAMKNNRLMAEGWRGTATPWLGATTALAFLGAGVLMTISSKEHKGDDVGAEALFSRLCTVNAKILAAFPEEQREPMLEKLTSYMRFRTDISGEKFNAERFNKEVQERITHMQHNPWIDRVHPSQLNPNQGMGVGAGAGIA